MTDADTDQLFSIEPDPPERGKKVKITYTGSPIECTVTITPPGTSTSMTSSPLELDVPDAALTFVCHDNSGASIDLARVVA